jgi:spoIIIJ-associated protein
MGTSEDNFESSGSNVEQAIANGLEQLGLSRSEVDVEILDEGSPGFLGIRGRDATVKLRQKIASPGEKSQVSDPAAMPAAAAGAAGDVAADPRAETSQSSEDKDQHWEEEIALEVVDQLLEKMEVDATTNLRQTEPDDLTGEQRWVVDVHGQDLGLLIGSRGDTLNAFQFVARLMTGHKTHRRPNFLIDVEGYRLRREQALARLAERMAGKALKRGRPVTLEPMPPNERRIIHITLRQDARVYTESTGEGQQRRVRIYLNNDSQ